MPYLKRINSLPLINHISYKYAQVSDIGPSWSSCCNCNKLDVVFLLYVKCNLTEDFYFQITVDTNYLEVRFREFPDISKCNLSPDLSCSYFHTNTNFYVQVPNPSTSLIPNFLCTYSVLEIRHTLINQTNDSSLWASPA